MLKKAIYGLAIAAAIGVPYEFRYRDTFECTGVSGYGTYNQPPGTWSDDTSMTIATCRSIKENGGKIVCQDLMDKFLSWYLEGEYTPFQETFDIGNTTRAVLNDYRRSRDPLNCGRSDQYSNGNGSLMRILPLAFLDVDGETIEKVSALTHAHELSKKACVLYIHIARGLLNGLGVEAAIAEALAGIPKPERFSRVGCLDRISREEIKSSGYVLDTLEAALWCLIHSDSYKQCVLMAVNLGEDTDTVAAVAGGLAGILYGVPEDWLNELQRKDLIDDCLFQ